MSNKLLIVDGNNLLFQMFYGIPAKIYNKRGRTIHATIGFVSALQKMVKSYEINRCVVVFDYDGSEERKELLDTYKANREQNWEELPQDEVPFFEEEYIFACLQYLGVCLLQSKNMEADDLIASIALQESKQNQVYIASFDSDFFQLIDEKVSVIRYRGEKTKLVTKQSFIEEFSFSPSCYAFYKALTGDTADNIQGVPSIGKKRAAEIVKNCACIEGIKLDGLAFLPCKARECVFSSFAVLERNLALITLQAKEIEAYDARFDEEKMRLRNSQILSACRIFD